MALVDPYSPCLCGSGQKYKWCCQKVEAYAERAQRLVENGQYEAALKPLDEGLAKVPANPWLSTRKALVQLQLNQLEAAKHTLRTLAPEPSRQPGGMVLLTRLVAGNRGPDRGGRPVPASLVERRETASATSLHRWPHSSVRRSARRGFTRRRSSISNSPVELQSRRAQAELLAGPEPQDEPGDLRLGEESLSSLAGSRPRLGCRPRIVRAGAEVGQMKGSGRPRHRRSSCWRLAPAADASRRPQSGPVLPLDRRSRGRSGGTAPLHRAHRPHARRRGPRGPLPEDRPQSRPTIKSNSFT